MALATLEGRRARAEEIDRAIGDWTRGRESSAAEAELQRCGVAAQAAHRSEGYLGDPQIQRPGVLVEVDVTGAGKLPIEGTRFRLSRTPGEVRSNAPRLGEQTHEVLEGVLGYDSDRITELVIAGALG